MADFDDMVKRVQNEFALKRSSEQTRQEQKQAARDAVIASGVDILKSRVRKIFEEARDAFAKNEILSEIKENFKSTHPATESPSIAFRCISSPRKSDGYIHRGNAVVVSSDGKSVFTGVTEYESDERPIISPRITTPDDCEQAIGEAIEKILKIHIAKSEEL